MPIGTLLEPQARASGARMTEDVVWKGRTDPRPPELGHAGREAMWIAPADRGRHTTTSVMSGFPRFRAKIRRRAVTTVVVPVLG